MSSEYNYYDFGLNEPVEKKYLDPVDSCLAGKLFKTDNPLRFQATLCNDYMSQRCAKNWDDKCQLFFEQSVGDSTKYDVKNFGDKTFLEDVARNKYCTLDQNDPNAKCYQICEPWNPIAQTSPEVCKTYGSVVYQDNSYLQDIAGDFPATAKLRTSSPIKISKCPVLCEGVNKIEKDDPVIKRCLENGQCQDVLQNLAIYAYEKNLPVENIEFKKFMDSFITAPPKPSTAVPQQSTTSITPTTLLSNPFTKTQIPARQQSLDSSKVDFNPFKDRVDNMLGSSTAYQPAYMGVDEVLKDSTLPKERMPTQFGMRGYSLEDQNKVVMISNCSENNKDNTLQWIIIIGVVILIMMLCHHIKSMNMTR